MIKFRYRHVAILANKLLPLEAGSREKNDFDYTQMRETSVIYMDE
jgi:hypothetical protein